MDKQPAAPKRFGATAAAAVDVNRPPRVALSTYAGQELLLRGYHMARSEFGDYAVILLQRHGAPAEEVTCSGETVLEQLAAVSPEDWQGGIVAWLHQAKSVGGKTGRLWFSDAAPEGDVSKAPVGKRGD